MDLKCNYIPKCLSTYLVVSYVPKWRVYFYLHIYVYLVYPNDCLSFYDWSICLLFECRYVFMSVCFYLCMMYDCLYICLFVSRPVHWSGFLHHDFAKKRTIKKIIFCPIRGLLVPSLFGGFCVEYLIILSSFLSDFCL